MQKKTNERKHMSILGLIVILLILAGAAWLINTKTSMSAGWKMFFNIVLGAIALIIVLNAFGILDSVRNKPVPHIFN
jgi:hypothetical protein